MKNFPALTLALLLLAGTLQAQSTTTATPNAAQTPTQPEAPTPGDELACRVLTGRVTDKFASPLTGATVMLRSRTRGFSAEPFSTNAEGKYLLTCKQPIPRNTILEVTAAGYTSVELSLVDCQPQDFTLEPLPGTRFKSDGRIKRSKNTGKIH